jgi:hypothetical protein
MKKKFTEEQIAFALKPDGWTTMSTVLTVLWATGRPVIMRDRGFLRLEN